VNVRRPFGQPRLRVLGGGLSPASTLNAAAEPAAEPAAETPATTPDYVTQLLPIATALIDSSQTPEVVAAKVANYRKLRDRLPKGSAGWQALDNRIRVLQAKYKASSKSKASEREWSTLGKTGLVVGIGVGAALLAFLIAATMRQQRADRRPEAA